MKRKNMDQKEYSFQHTKERCKERYGIDLSKMDYSYLCSKIKDRQCEFISHAKQGNGVQSICKVNFFNEADLYAVYLNETELIKTVLPREGFEFYER